MPFAIYLSFFNCNILHWTSLEGAVAGAAAGVVVEAALYPIDTIKTRLQAGLFC